MFYRFAADVTLLFHLAFILLVVVGALLTVKWRWVPLIQLPAAGWGVFVELADKPCPLTDMENFFLAQAGQAGYGGSFIEHYLLDIIYPAGLTSDIQLLLGGIVVLANVAIYGWLILRWRWR
jgi:hypothetical protein